MDLLEFLHKRPLVKAVLLFFCGFILSWQLFGLLPVYYIFAAAVSLLTISLLFAKSDNFKAGFSFMLLILFCGMLVGLKEKHDYDQTPFQLKNSPERIIFQAVITDDDLAGARKLRQAELKYCVIADDFYIDCGKTWLRTDRIPNLNYGDILSGSGTIEEIRFPRNPGEFDFRRYSKLRGIDGIIKPDKDRLTIAEGRIPPYRNFLRAIRRDINCKVDEYIGGDSGELLKSLILGVRTGLSEEFTANLRLSGLWHLVSISGLHLGIFAGLMWLISSFLNLPLRYRNVLTIVFIWLFVGVAEVRASLLRAAIILTLWLSGRFIKRNLDIWNLLALSALIIFIIDPGEIFQAGFQLSFSAVIFIIAGFSVWDKVIPKRLMRMDYIRSICRGFFTSLLAAMGTAPILAYHFGGFSLASIPSSVAGIALVGIIMGVFPLFYSLTFIVKPLSVILANSLILMVEGLSRLVDEAAEWGLYFSYPESEVLVIVITLIALLALVLRRRMALYLIMFLALLLTFRSIYHSGNACVTYLDVGQGNCALIELPGDIEIMIDAGPATARYNSAQSAILPFLKYKAIDDIDYLILTHEDKDHSGGADFLLLNFKVENVITGSSFPYGLENYHWQEVAAGDYIKTGGALVTFLNPSGEFTDDNSASLVIRIDYDEISLLFPGDIPAKIERKLLVYGELLEADVLLASHHGSKYSNSREFLQAVSPLLVIFSSGRNNMYHHPSPETMIRLDNLEVPWYRTDQAGALVLSIDDGQCNKVRWRK